MGFTLSVCDPLKILTFVFRGLILHAQKVANNRTWGFTWSYHISSRTCSASASVEKHNKARLYIYMLEGKTNQVIAPAPHARTQLSILPSQCSLFIIIIKKQSVKHMGQGKKHTAQFKYIVKSVPLSVITVPPWSYAKHLFSVDIGTRLKQTYIKGK